MPAQRSKGGSAVALRQALAEHGLVLPAHVHEQDVAFRLDVLKDARGMAAGLTRAVASKAAAVALVDFTKAAKRLATLTEPFLRDQGSAERAFIDSRLPPLGDQWTDLLGFVGSQSQLELLYAAVRAVASLYGDANTLAEQGDERADDRLWTENYDEHLVCDELPRLYEDLFGKRCGWSGSSGKKGEPTEGVRFIVASLQFMGVHKEPAAVIKTRQRARAKNKEDIGAKLS